MDDSLRERLFHNTFAPKFHFEGKIDREDLASLEDTLLKIEQEWKQKELIDKEVASFLYELYGFVFIDLGLTQKCESQKELEAQNVAILLEELIRRCLKAPPSNIRPWPDYIAPWDR